MKFELYHGDCLEVMKEFSDNSVDSIVTDPPYGLSKQPDMAEVLRHWLDGDDYIHKGRGFMGKEWDSFVPGPSVWKECFRVLKPGGHMVAFFGTRTYDLGVLAIRLAGFEIRDQIAWVYGSGFPKSLNVGKAVDAHNKTGQVDYKKGRMFSSDIENDDTIQDVSNPWKGWGTALKPAFEPIVLVRKPLEDTVAKNVLQHGVGGINIDECRIETNPDVDDSRLGGKGSWKTDKSAKNVYGGGLGGNKVASSSLGRFPANFIHDGSDEVVELFPHTKSGSITAEQQLKGGFAGSNGGTIYGTAKHGGTFSREGSEGSASRFFYCAKASKRDRNEGIDHLSMKIADPYAQHRGRRMNDNDIRFDGKEPSRGQNFHPTVKPTALIEYLCRLITPPGGTILDPFMGSGSTGKAAMYEGFNFIGIELMEEYLTISEARIEAARKDAYEISIGAKSPKVVAKKEAATEEQSNSSINKFFE